MKLPSIILASASPRRVELLRQLKLEFEVLPTDAPEVMHEFLTPLEVCQLNAHRKARIIAKKIPDSLVIAADTLVFLNGEIFGKPKDMPEAVGMLSRLQGKTHQVVTGVCLVHLRAHRERLFTASTDVTFHPLDEAQIKSYLSKINPLDKAGAYAIQEFGEKIIAEISGSYSNVVGLPIEQVREELTAFKTE